MLVLWDLWATRHPLSVPRAISHTCQKLNRVGTGQYLDGRLFMNFGFLFPPYFPLVSPGFPTTH